MAAQDLPRARRPHPDADGPHQRAPRAAHLSRGAAPDVEERLIPTTWREIGVGFYGECGRFTIALRRQRTELRRLHGRRDQRGTAGGLRGPGPELGRHGPARLDALRGHARGRVVLLGQLRPGAPTPSGLLSRRDDTLDVHADWKVARAVAARPLRPHDDRRTAAAINEVQRLRGRGVGRQRAVGLVRAGRLRLLSLKAGSRAALTPFVRYERYDTQASRARGLCAQPRERRDAS